MADLVAAQRDLRLFRGQVFPRAKELISHWAFIGAIGAGGLAAALASTLPGGELRITEVATIGITFASIAMGACVSAIVLSLGLPGAARLRTWARMRGTTAGKSALSDLVFVVVWASMSQMALIVVCVLATLFGGNLAVAPADLSVAHAFALWGGISVFFYALFELVVVVLTLMQIGVLIIVEEQVSPAADGGQPTADHSHGREEAVEGE